MYTVVYRVTSADGHPIEGQFAFTASGEVAYGVAPSVRPDAHGHRFLRGPDAHDLRVGRPGARPSGTSPRRR